MSVARSMHIDTMTALVVPKYTNACMMRRTSVCRDATASTDAVLWLSTGKIHNKRQKSRISSVLPPGNTREVHIDISCAVRHKTNAETVLLIGMWSLTMYVAMRIDTGNTWLLDWGIISERNWFEKTMEAARHRVVIKTDVVRVASCAGLSRMLVRTNRMP